jgi:hypothetical protein
MSAIKKFIVVLVATIFVCLLGIWVVGAISQPTYHIAKEARYAGTQDQVWAFISQEPTANPSTKMNYKVTSSNPSQYLAIAVQSPNFDITAQWEYRLASVSTNVTSVDISQTLTINNSWIRGVMVLTGRGSQLKQEHRRLADEFEFAE